MKKIISIIVAVLLSSFAFAKGDADVGFIFNFGYAPKYDKEYTETTDFLGNQNVKYEGQDFLGELGFGGYSNGSERLQAGLFFGLGFRKGTDSFDEKLWGIKISDAKFWDIYARADLGIEMRYGIFSIGSNFGVKLGFERFTWAEEIGGSEYKNNIIFLDIPVEPYIAFTIPEIMRIGLGCEWSLPFINVNFINDDGKTKTDFNPFNMDEFFGEHTWPLTLKLTVALFL